VGIATTIDVTFVIPCLNEEEEIPTTIESIRDAVPPGVTYEVVVADHGSSDGTVERATAADARVFSFPDVKLGDLRNCGARKARGRILVFLDADISLTDRWGREFPATLERLKGGDRIVTGSRTRYLHSDHWTARGFGMDPEPDGPVPYLGTAHLIVERGLFFEIGGFPGELESGEDEAFGRRARALGIEVIAQPSLVAIHRGAPASLRGFFLRHLWHGMGDVRDLRRVGPSRTVLLGTAFLLGHLLAGVLLVFPGGLHPAIWIAPSLLLAGPVVGKIWQKRSTLSARDLPASLGAHYLYFLARGLGPWVRVALGHGRRAWGRR
jgi:hypothetical protein